ncbi:ferredoxin [Nocardia sp. CA-129566]|uniref:ferredoxin n=1 Tax=Nocardia sp. CA-129566 TaxID=3239976 RepID=UPI003D965547
MKITADRSRCEGHGMCEALLPNIFQVDDSGKVHILVTEVPAPDQPDVELAIETCPVQALHHLPD